MHKRRLRARARREEAEQARCRSGSHEPDAAQHPYLPMTRITRQLKGEGRAQRPCVRAPVRLRGGGDTGKSTLILRIGSVVLERPPQSQPRASVDKYVVSSSLRSLGRRSAAFLRPSARCPVKGVGEDGGPLGHVADATRPSQRLGSRREGKGARARHLRVTLPPRSIRRLEAPSLSE